MDNPRTRVIPDFENELKTIDSRLSVVPNPNREYIANIKLDGTDVCPIPRYEIREHTDPTYTIEMPNGILVPHKSKEEALEHVKRVLELIKTNDGSDQFHGRNGW